MLAIILNILVLQVTSILSLSCPPSTSTTTQATPRLIAMAGEPREQNFTSEMTRTDWIKYCISIGSDHGMPISYTCTVDGTQQAIFEIQLAWTELKVAIDDCLPHVVYGDTIELSKCMETHLATARTMLEAAFKRAIDKAIWCILNEKHLTECYFEGLCLAIDKIYAAYNLAIYRLQVIQNTILGSCPTCHVEVPPFQCLSNCFEATVTEILKGFPMSYHMLMQGIAAACNHLINVCLTLGSTTT